MRGALYKFFYSKKVPLYFISMPDAVFNLEYLCLDKAFNKKFVLRHGFFGTDDFQIAFCCFPCSTLSKLPQQKLRTYIEQLALNLSKMKKLFLKEKSTFFRDILPDLSKSYLSLLVITKISLLSSLLSTCVSSPPLWKTDNYHTSKMFFKVCCNMVFTIVTLVWKFWLDISTVLCCPNKSYIKTSLNHKF